MKQLLKTGLLVLAMLVTACTQSTTEEAPSGFEDVEDIPIPSQNLSDNEEEVEEEVEEEEDDFVGDDDDTTDEEEADEEEEEAAGDDDDTVEEEEEEETTPETTSPITYTITDADSLLYVQVYKDPTALLQSFAHDHVMRATNWTGTFEYDPADLGSCNFDISIDVEDMLVDEDGMRSFVGYGDTINSSDRATIRENMLSEDQLNSASFSEISLVSQSCGAGSGAGTTNGILPVTATMNLRGVNQTKSVNLDLTIQDGEAYLQGSFNLTTSEFGFSGYQFLGGGVRNLEEMTISFDMVGFASN